MRCELTRKTRTLNPKPQPELWHPDPEALDQVCNIARFLPAETLAPNLSPSRPCRKESTTSSFSGLAEAWNRNREGVIQTYTIAMGLCETPHDFGRLQGGNGTPW